MKSIAIFLVLLVPCRCILGQTPPLLLSEAYKEIVKDLSPKDESYSRIDPKEIRAYLNSNEDDRIDSALAWRWNKTLVKWMLTERVLYFYDGNNIPTSVINMQWDGSKWVNLHRNVLVFGNENNLLNDVIQNWTGTGWENASQYIYTYDTENNQTSKIRQLWDGVMWVNNRRFLYTYDNQHNVLTEISEFWVDSEWTMGYKYVNTYNEENLWIIQELQYWNGSNYATDRQVFFQYNSGGYLDTSLTQQWETDHWEIDGRSIYEYDANHNNTLKTRQVFDSLEHWINYYRVISTYDAWNSLTSQAYQISHGEEWDYTYQLLAGNDERQNRLFEVYQVWEEKWVSTDSFHNYFTLTTSIAPISDPKNFRLYPNPVRSTLNLQFDEIDLNDAVIDIYSNTGIKVMHLNLADHKTFALDVRKLVAGSYFLCIYSLGNYQVIPFLKQ